MKIAAIAGLALIVLCAAARDSGATEFDYTGAIVDWTVPADGDYLITASGASGGSTPSGGSGNGAGGLSATLSAMFTLYAGEELQIAVGGMGVSSSGGIGGSGGGGTWVVTSTDTPC